MGFRLKLGALSLPTPGLLNFEFFGRLCLDGIVFDGVCSIPCPRVVWGRIRMGAFRGVPRSVHFRRSRDRKIRFARGLSPFCSRFEFVRHFFELQTRDFLKNFSFSFRVYSAAIFCGRRWFKSLVSFTYHRTKDWLCPVSRSLVEVSDMLHRNCWSSFFFKKKSISDSSGNFTLLPS